MADPTRYHPHFNYSGWEAAGSKRPKPGAELDIDFANIARSVDETIDALKDIRRSDGKLKNGIVDKDALDASSVELWESAEVAATEAGQSAQAAEEARDIAKGYASDAVSQGNVPIYASAATVQGLEIPAGITAFRTNGYATPGDGEGLLYVEGVERPGAIRDAAGRWFEDVSYNTITVRIPSQFPTLQAAVDHYSRLPMRQGAIIELLIESGHQPASGISVANGDYSHFYVRSEDAIVLLDPSFGRSGQAFIAGDNAGMPVLDCLVNANEQLNNGYLARNSSKGLVTPYSGITHVWGTGLNVSSGSNVSAADTIWTDCAINGNTGSGAVVTGAYLYAPRLDVSRSGYYGAQSAYGAVADFSGGIANDCVRYGFRCRNASSMDLEGGQANNCGVNAIRAFHNGQIAARYFEGKNAGQDGVYAADASTVVVRDADLTGATRYGIVSGSSKVDARGTNAQRGGSPSSSDFRVESGGEIVLGGSYAGGISKPANIPTNSGTIYVPDQPSLDDRYFQRGNWTPELTCSNPGNLSVSYGDNVGRYVRAGDMVTITFTLVTSSFTHSSASGSVRIAGLPFPSVDLFRTNWHGSAVVSNIDKPGYSYFTLELNEGSDYINIRAAGDGTARAFVSIEDLPSGSTIRIEGTLTYWRA